MSYNTNTHALYIDFLRHILQTQSLTFSGSSSSSSSSSQPLLPGEGEVNWAGGLGSGGECLGGTSWYGGGVLSGDGEKGGGGSRCLKTDDVLVMDKYSSLDTTRRPLAMNPAILSSIPSLT